MRADVPLRVRNGGFPRAGISSCLMVNVLRVVREAQIQRMVGVVAQRACAPIMQEYGKRAAHREVPRDFCVGSILRVKPSVVSTSITLPISAVALPYGIPPQPHAVRGLDNLAISRHGDLARNRD